MECVGCLGVHLASDVPRLLGLTPAVVRRLIRDGVLVRVRQGVLAGKCTVARAAEDANIAHLLAVQGQLLNYAEAYASHESAAIAHGLPLLALPTAPLLTRPSGAWRGGDAGRIRIAPLPEHHRVVVQGIRATSLPRTFVDIARSSSMAAAVIVGDYVRRWRCTQEELEAMLAECSAWSDVGKARQALAFLDPRSESPLESVSRVYMHEFDLPAPQLQALVRGASGSVYRADFYWEFAQLVGEADGMGKYGKTPEEIAAALRAEKMREDDIRDGGYGVVRWNYAQMLGQTAETMGRIARRLDRR